MELDHTFDIVTITQGGAYTIYLVSETESNERSNCSNRECV